jgi:hypothetical protein
MNAENAYKGWILDVFEKKNDAWLCEQICSYKYGIPQVTWVQSNTKFCETDVIKLYENLGDLRNKAIACLNNFNRNIEYPIFECGINKHFSKVHVTEVSACNLIPIVMDVAIPQIDEKGYYHNMYDTICSIDIRHGVFDVFCISIEGTGTYVGNGILTHNSIFAFKGGDVQIFLSLMNNPDWKAYQLTENYRTAKSILMYANSIVNKADNIIKKNVVFKNENKGQLDFTSKRLLDNFLKDIKEDEDWMILTRSNKEMTQIDSLLRKLNKEHYCLKQSTISTKKMKEIMSKPCIKVMTIHSAKGLESENVALYGKLPVKGTGDSDELKVFYVGITRAKNKCVIFI